VVPDPRRALASEITTIEQAKAHAGELDGVATPAIPRGRRWPRGTLYQLEQRLEIVHQRVMAIKAEASRVLVGLDALVHGLLLGVFAGGHVLVNGPPGSAKTLATRTLAAALGATFTRIELTPDLDVGDLVGSVQVHRSRGDIIVCRGPIFANVVLADRLDRAAQRVQAALLDAMRESHCRIGEQRFGLPAPFFVVATSTQAHDHTTPIRAAHLDRFLLSLVTHVPRPADELRILDLVAGADAEPVAAPQLTPAAVVQTREIMRQICVDDQVKRYAIDLVAAIRDRIGLHTADPVLLVGHSASVLASIALVKVARAHALLDSRAHVTPFDVKQIAPMVLRHRIAVRSHDAASGADPADVIAWLAERVPLP
jgi:MoxR-like ATPase